MINIKTDISDGFSLDINGNAPTSGYMVSFAGYERVFDGVPSMDEIELFIIQHSTLLGVTGTYLGGWLDGETGKFYLDISENIQDKAQALEVAAERKQLAIFDLSTFESIYL